MKLIKRNPSNGNLNITSEFYKKVLATSCSILVNFSDSQYEDISLYNFFNDRNIMPIEISVDHDLTQLELMQMFEKLKSQIGEPCTYELLEADKLELEKLKERIFEKQELEKAADEKMLIDKEREENENQIEEWVSCLHVYFYLTIKPGIFSIDPTSY